ncbi:hypothetical protein FSP39_007679 [Pinctada imbricata]|uniref:Uncharacterized protein n=1 Tax=Pinctada imbricata TaxID=66713 RepID=A0AA89BVX9_PINIB|nr:hypothetical protein FSP39_007679 [Pinctada imbricata]
MFMKRLCVVVLFLSCLKVTLSQTKSDYEGIMMEVFTTNGYNKKILPKATSNNPVEIDLSFVLLGINEIDELAEKMTTTAYLVISWTDPGLEWDPAEHGDTDNIYVPQDDIWKPDIFLQNGFTKFKELGGSFYYIPVEFEGRPTWMPFEVFESRCSLDTSYYPFDEQICSIAFVVWSHSVEEVEITKSTYGIRCTPEFNANNVWDILSISSAISRETRESKLTFTFHLKRKSLYYVVNIILPVVFLGLLNGLVFIIPADSGEKTGYSVTVFLSLVVFLTIISTILPVNSEKVSLFGIFLFLQVIIGVMVLIVTTMQLRLNARSTFHPVEGIFLQVAKLGKNTCCCQRKKNRRILPSNKIHIVECELGNNEKESPPHTDYTPADDAYLWCDVVTGIDVIGFWCFVLAYSVVTATMFSFLVT